MLHTNFSSNINNHLCNFCFSDIRIDHSLELYQEREIKLRGSLLGTARIVAMRNFPMGHLTNELSFSVCGHNANYLRALLQKFYGNLTEYSRITWVIFEWVKPDMVAMQQLYNEAWQKTIEKFITAYRDTLENKNLQFTLDL